VHKRQFIKAGLYGITGITGVLILVKFLHTKVMSLPVVKYPNPILRSVADPVNIINDKVISLAHKMIGILRTRAPLDFFLKGALYKGLSAPQIGIQKRLMVCGLHGSLKVLVNPEILARKGTYENSEYCLSLPGYPARMVPRSASVKVGYRNLQGKEEVLVATKHSAGLIEHEMDHLNGVLYIDYQ
jgi:peptide deformylase